MKNKPWNLKPILGLTALAISGILFVQCDLPGSTSGSGSSVSTSPLYDVPHTLTYSNSYQIVGNSIVSTMMDTSYGCNGTNLTVYKDTFTDTMPYRIEGTVLSFSEYDSIWDTSESFVASVRNDLNYNRIESGSGLQGLWQFSGRSYKVVSGSLSADQKSELDHETIGFNQYSTYYDRDQIQVTATELSYYHEVKSSQLFMDFWNGNAFGETSLPRKVEYKIDASVVDQYTVKMKGKTTGETVNYTRYGDYTQIYTSSNTAHHTLTISRREIPNCSSGDTPDWISSFYDDNAVPIDTAAGVAAKRGNLLIEKPPFVADPFLNHFARRKKMAP